MAASVRVFFEHPSYIGIMKNVTYVTLCGAYLFSKVHICDEKIAYLDDIANLEILPYGLHFSEFMSFTKIIKGVISCYKVMVPLSEC